MGGNTLVKYLGECGRSSDDGHLCLPNNVVGAASLGNPLEIDHNKLEKPWSYLLAIGAKKSIMKHRENLLQCPHFKQNFKNALLAPSLAETSSFYIQQMIRNEPFYPFENRIGYESLKEYWEDASSYRYISHVIVPLVVAFANDDEIASGNTRKYMNYGLSNPNVIFVNTASGGHLGWHHAMKNNPFGSWNFYSRNDENDKDWGTLLTTKFIDSIIKKQFHNKIASRKRLDRKILVEDSFDKVKKIRARM